MTKKRKKLESQETFRDILKTLFSFKVAVPLLCGWLMFFSPFIGFVVDVIFSGCPTNGRVWNAETRDWVPWTPTPLANIVMISSLLVGIILLWICAPRLAKEWKKQR